MMRVLWFAVVLLAAPAALAQAPAQVASAEEAPRVLPEIERGVYVRALAGPSFLFNLPSGGGFSAGASLGLEVGTDLGDDLQLGAFVLGGFQAVSTSWKGASGTARGDLDTSLVALSGRLALASFDDGKVERTQLYLRGAAGALFARPEGAVGSGGAALLLGPGVEYHTRLRRFAVSLGLDGLVARPSSGTLFGAVLAGSLRYTF